MEHDRGLLYTGMIANTGYSSALVLLVWTIFINFSQAGYTLQRTTTKDWDDIKNLCEQNGQRMIKIDSMSVFNDVKQFLDGESINTDVWIGLRLDTGELPSYIYKFVDGTTSSFFQWDGAVNEPNEQNTDFCIKLESSMDWKYRTNPCTRNLYGLCEDVQTTTSEPTKSTFQEESTTSTIQEESTPSTNQEETTSSFQTTTATDTSTEATNIHTDITTTFSAESSSGTFSTELTTIIDSCECPCGLKMDNLTLQELDALLQEVKNKLQISKTSLSSYVRSKTSAADKRTSSKVIGTVGTLIITLVITILILPDMMSVLAKTKQCITCQKRGLIE